MSTRKQELVEIQSFLAELKGSVAAMEAELANSKPNIDELAALIEGVQEDAANTLNQLDDYQ
jgi:t-SNARE complex subunit (syntaxin)